MPTIYSRTRCVVTGAPDRPPTMQAGTA
jgi:hypothetical protein